MSRQTDRDTGTTKGAEEGSEYDLLADRLTDLHQNFKDLAASHQALLAHRQAVVLPYKEAVQRVVSKVKSTTEFQSGNEVN